MTIDVERARALTPGCEEVLHLNHAGASLLPQPVLDAVVGHLELEARTGGYEAAADAAAGDAAPVHGAGRADRRRRPDQIALLDSASRAWDMAVYSLPLEPHDRVLIGRAEYGANAISLLQLQQRTGCQLVLVEDDAARADGPRGARSGRSPRTRRRMVSLVHVPTQSGLVNPAVGGRAAVPRGRRAVRARRLPVGRPAARSTCSELGCGILTGNGRKFLRGPRGTGFLCDAPRADPADRAGDARPPRRHAGSRPTATRSAATPGASRCGSATRPPRSAWGWRSTTPSSGASRPSPSATPRWPPGCAARLAELPGVTVRDRGEQLCAITTFTVDGMEPEEVRARLRAEGVNVSVSTLDSAQLDLSNRGLESVVRASRPLRHDRGRARPLRERAPQASSAG